MTTSACKIRALITALSLIFGGASFASFSPYYLTLVFSLVGIVVLVFIIKAMADDGASNQAVGWTSLTFMAISTCLIAMGWAC